MKVKYPPIGFLFWCLAIAAPSCRAGPIELSVRWKGDVGTYLQTSTVKLELADHTLWAYMTVENISKGPVTVGALYARFLADSAQECFSLVFTSKASAPAGKEVDVLRPGEKREFYSASVAQLPAVRPSTALVYAITKIEIGHPLEPGNFVSVPPTVSGGFSPARGNLSVNYGPARKPYLALVSAAIDARGAAHDIRVVEAADEDVAGQVRVFTEGLRFEPAVKAGQSVASHLLLLFMELHSAAFSSDPGIWPWDLRRVMVAAKRDATPDEVGTVAELGFESEHDVAGPDSHKLTYNSVGTDWCGNAFTWKRELETHHDFRIWSPN
jgi:hypothetical protein